MSPWGGFENTVVSRLTATSKFNSHETRPSRPSMALLLGIWVCLKMVSTPKPNGFADHYPEFKWLFHWEYTQHFQTNLFSAMENHHF